MTFALGIGAVAHAGNESAMKGGDDMTRSHAELMERSCDESFQSLNTNPAQDDHISVTEATGQLPDGMFSLLDADNSRTVTRQEFQWCKTAISQRDDGTVYALVYPQSDMHPAESAQANPDIVCTYRFEMANGIGASANDDHIDVTEANRLPDGMFEALDTDDSRTVTRDEFQRCVAESRLDGSES